MLKKQKKLILTEDHQEAMRRAGRVNGQLMDFLRPHVKAGVTTLSIDALAHQWTLDHGHKPATLGYQNYPKSCCTSINDVICHGIPDSYELKDGDIVNVDITTIVDGWHGDQSETFLIGEVSEEKRAVTQCAFDCLYAAIDALTPGCPVSVIGETVVPEAHRRGFSVVREYVGHGLGRSLHEAPEVPNYGRRGNGPRLMDGMVLAIEPMINLGRKEVFHEEDGWTIVTADRKVSAHFEHDIVVRKDRADVLSSFDEIEKVLQQQKRKV